MSTTLESRPDPARRRRALQIGLETLLTPMQVKAALHVWDDQYAPTRSMALAEYVADIAQRLDYSMQERHALRVALYHSISMNDVRQGSGAAVAPSPPPAPPRPAPPTPASAPLSTPSPAAASKPSPPPAPIRRSSSPSYVVFARMAKEILAHVERDGAVAVEDFCAALERHSDALRLSVEQVVCMRRWGKGSGTLDALSDLPESQLALLIHAAYASTAEALGPTMADRVLARAVTAAEALPEALQFPPRRLL